MLRRAFRQQEDLTKSGVPDAAWTERTRHAGNQDPGYVLSLFAAVPLALGMLFKAPELGDARRRAQCCAPRDREPRPRTAPEEAPRAELAGAVPARRETWATGAFRRSRLGATARLTTEGVQYPALAIPARERGASIHADEAPTVLARTSRRRSWKITSAVGRVASPSNSNATFASRQEVEPMPTCPAVHLNLRFGDRQLQPRDEFAAGLAADSDRGSALTRAFRRFLCPSSASARTSNAAARPRQAESMVHEHQRLLVAE